MIEYTLIRSARKTLAIEINAAGEVIVRAPMRMGTERIRAFLEEKQSWIITKQQIAKSRTQTVSHGLENGSRMPYFGAALRVVYYRLKKPLCYRNCLLLPQQNPQKAFLEWRLQQAEELIRPRVEYWCRRTGLQYSQLHFGNAKGRWGSMSSDKAMRLNTALVHCPARHIDYVIVHELCHILHPDHSPAFHAAVRSFLPGADTLRAEMRRNGPPYHPTAS